jgi:hypothetical protein
MVLLWDFFVSLQHIFEDIWIVVKKLFVPVG